MSWLKVQGATRSDIASELEERVAQRISLGAFSRDNVQYIKKINLSISGELSVTDESLERLRKLCQLWDVDFRVSGIRSHRRVIGPIIVAVKKAIFPVLKLFLKEFITQQRAFNAEVISYLAFISNKK